MNMKAEEPLLHSHNNPMIPHLRSYIVDKVENENDITVLQRLYAVITLQSDETYEEKFAQAKEQTEKYCAEEIAQELEAGGYMLGKPYPIDDSNFDFDQAIREDELDEEAPDEWVEKMFPELHVKG